MSATDGGLKRAHALGLALSGAVALAVAGLVLTKAVPPGHEALQGGAEQVGYLGTGLVFLAAAWVWGGSLRALKQVAAAPPADLGAFALKQHLRWAAALSVSSLCGLAYWSLVGDQALRHVWGFILLGPGLTVALTPRPSRWQGSR